jgi:hypothetical protein
LLVLCTVTLSYARLQICVTLSARLSSRLSCPKHSTYFSIIMH